MYLTTDVIMAMIEDEEWFNKEVDRSRIIDPKTSVMTIFEILRIDSQINSAKQDILEKIKKEKIEILSLTPDMTEKIQYILNKHSDMFDIGSLESIHVAHSLSIDDTIISTNKMYSYIDEVKYTDPRHL